jgi:D-alanine-D-alanine ligase
MSTPQRSVLVLHEALRADARPDELDVLVQVREISEAIEQLHWRANTLEVDLDLKLALERLKDRNPACVFNLVESLQGRGELIGLVPAVLASASIPFTGSDSEAITLSSQKILAKRWMGLNGIPTPEWHSAAEFADGREDENRSWIVKSLWEHASFGIDDASVVRGRGAAEQRIRQCIDTYGGRWFAEEYVDGREFNISIIEQKGQPLVLPIAEMTFVGFPPDKPKIVGYQAKWNEGAPEYAATQRRFEVSGADRDALTAVAKKCWMLFGLRGYARVDVRMDQQGTPFVLEVNANPCLAKDAGFIAAAIEAGFRYRQVIEMVLHAAIRPVLPVLRRAG